MFVLGAALMVGRPWQSAVPIVLVNRAIDQQEHLPHPNRQEIIALSFWPDKRDRVRGQGLNKDTVGKLDFHGMIPCKAA
jgi:hypothetical protein